MYKRFLVAFLCLSLFCLRAFSQDKTGRELFSHSIGFTGFGGIMDDYSAATDYTGFGFTYSPRFNFAILSPSSSFSIGTHLSAGFSISAEDLYVINGDDNQAAFMLDAPLLLEYNFGNAATREAYKKWGFFVGAGYGWHISQAKVAVQDEYYGYGYLKEDIRARGPVFDAGMRFPIALASLGVRFSYQVNNNPGVVANIKGIFGFGVEYNFGAPTYQRKRAHVHYRR
ncbi:hypothetical protein GA0116948_103362 [Chitinophaga costaii]|uniref:Outer membrane protein beta-barrel domain-containing protein n=1 Tax=Chitinophaga costaii TaxID=1335309 RepID=A0A1C4C1U4_9BACT|nr:hypothetical protein [Chitinophaga costaii]PUZ27372.1 hypothetical protein DCM91_03855 [Chitinophaga costaii]SCC13040.1 hypothetical protein GA0116948_103362 [Chitinophaga costaii]